MWQEKPSEDGVELTLSSKGRQRKKNSKYLDYEIDDKAIEPHSPQTARKSPGGRRAASQKPWAKSKTAKTATQDTVDGENEGTDKTPTECEGQTTAETAKEPVRGKKAASKRTPAKKTPARKTSNTNVDFPDGEGVVKDTVQQENGTPKPKRKYVKRQPVQQVEPVKEKEPEEPDEEPGQGGRRRRGAAKAALKYLHNLAQEVFGHQADDPGDEDAGSEQKAKASKVGKGRKRKRFDSDAAEDEDFVPDHEEQEDADEMEDDEEEAADDSDLDSDFVKHRRNPPIYYVSNNNTCSYAKAQNGLNANIMKTALESAETTKKFREEHYSSWVFPEWVPSTNDWVPVPQSDLEKYLPRTLHSAAFKVSREGLKKEEIPLQRLKRFESMPPHPERWDMMLYAGGPVWALEWCPTPDGALATQYMALSCHQQMDDFHYVDKTYTGTGLVQLWDVGKLEYSSRPESKPVMVYSLAQDKGFIWHLKWCPAGGWELPSCARKAPFLPRLGLLAVATSTGVVTIYSMPHPDALRSSITLANSGKDIETPQIYKAKGVVTLKLGAFRAPRNEMSGLVLSMDWAPEKPHNIMAIGFYDGVVGLWDLTTSSALLRVREPDRSLSLLPYRCIPAHSNGVRALAFCPASRHLLVTAGDDRFVKRWDLRRLYDPITVQKRSVANEIHWPLNAPGVMMAQDNAIVAKSSHGVHYVDHHMRSVFVIPRTGTVWSLSHTEWINCVATADSLGEVIFSLLPQISCAAPYVKRTIERRFPIYVTSMVPYDATEEGNQKVAGEEEDMNTNEEQQRRETEEPGAAQEGGNENGNEGGRVRQQCPALRFQPYREAAQKYSLHYTDYDLRTAAGSEKRAVWKHMKDTELKAKLSVDDMPLSALYKVRFNPNMSCHDWVASGGQTGLVRFNCIRTLTNTHLKKRIGESQAQFNALYSPQGQNEAIETVTEKL
ncbi:general transcription factor 3C polypeptide 2 isoform X2 [Archocentrus centrarchus]|uniref:general transcription factor 3C polypeptide 2 isoform X2 n=1 Tax=Archocentrus centrarchus TaxID=63155 RepID=UPI0011E9BB9E|nr:general transcription factor 3C polypeptide 2 isoform X2 [Archocentrus centrarchus]XP_030578252.1 general transcription factor 3C polypeptide 2 isoform X2 [Archocentrus centrarchus]